MNLVKATRADADALKRLYRACAKGQFCAWDEDYPNDDTIREDLRFGGLFVLKSKGRIVACGSVIPPENEETGPMWTPCQSPCALSRIGVAPSEQGKGLSKVLLKMLLIAARGMGYDSARLLVSPQNPPAMRLYRGEGFRLCGMRCAWRTIWLCMEKPL